MVIFIYDHNFEGLLTALFEVYDRKVFPDLLLTEQDSLPLFYDEAIRIITDDAKARRVWKGLEKKLSPAGLSCITLNWLSELPASDMLLLRYMRKAFDSPSHIEFNFGDPDVLQVTQISKKVSRERHRLAQFIRFQKTADDIYFAPIEPLYNVLSLITQHFKDRYADQKWIIYDIKREYGYYYDLEKVTEIYFSPGTLRLISGHLADSLLAEDERLFQQLWKTYFTSTTIRERINPKLHRQNMPVRFWKYLTEKRMK